MSKAALHKRMRESAQDFWEGVRPPIEKQFNATILPLELLQENQAIKAFDQVGIDAFYLNKQGDLTGLASRVNYSDFAKINPSFTFRYAKWDKNQKKWDLDREYQRKLRVANNPTEFKFFPALHVESWSEQRGSGLIQWSYMADTKDILNYIAANLPSQDKKKVYTFKTDSNNDLREVVVVRMDAFVKDYKLVEVKISH